MSALAVIAFKAYIAAASGRNALCPFHPNSPEDKAWHKGAAKGCDLHQKAKKPMFTL